MILLADSEGPDQTARMRKLTWVFTVRRHIFAWREAFIGNANRRQKYHSGETIKQIAYLCILSLSDLFESSDFV